MRRGPFSFAFDRAHSDRAMSLSALHRVLSARGAGVSLATLSYWRSGQREPEQERSLRALAQVEEVLGLEPGALEALIEGRRRRVAPDATVPPPRTRSAWSGFPVWNSGVFGFRCFPGRSVNPSVPVAS